MTKLPVVKGVQSLEKLTPLQLYLQEIAKHPLLEPEEEYELARQHFDEGDIAAAHRLVTANLRLVVKIANDFRQAQMSALDLIQEGNYGLMQAVKRFNPYKGVKLSSYAAWWIRAYILKYIMDHKSQVKIGTTAAQRKLYYNLEKVRQRLLTEFDEADTALIAETLNVKEKDVIEMQQRLSAPDLSLDAPIAEEGGETRASLIEDDVQTAEQILANKEVYSLFSEYVDEFSDTLAGRDREIFDLRLRSDEPWTLQQVGDKFGFSRERARQIESRIIAKLRAFVNAKGTLSEDVIEQ